MLIAYESLKVIARELAAPWRRRRFRLLGFLTKLVAAALKMWGSVWSGPRPLAGWPEGTSRLVARERTRTRARRKMVSLLKCQTWCNHLERTFYKVIKEVALLIVKMHFEVVVLQRAGFCWIVKASDCEEIWEKKLWGGFLNDWRFSVFCCKELKS